mmetsp:Transcript_69733/g.202350  ORF Transcript_69733/g.202350 Transcript_69733/m.202350 type:complete len:221 (-) Transcript_69733:1251-1913(-)
MPTPPAVVVSNMTEHSGCCWNCAIDLSRALKVMGPLICKGSTPKIALICAANIAEVERKRQKISTFSPAPRMPVRSSRKTWHFPLASTSVLLGRFAMLTDVGQRFSLTVAGWLQTSAKPRIIAKTAAERPKAVPAASTCAKSCFCTALYNMRWRLVASHSYVCSTFGGKSATMPGSVFTRRRTKGRIKRRNLPWRSAASLPLNSISLANCMSKCARLGAK